MKISNRAIFAVALSFIFTLSIMGANAASTPLLGTTSTYGVLAHTFTYAHSGAVITGDLGYGTTSGTGGFPSVSGTTSINNAAYNQAGADQGTVLTALNSQPCTVNLPSNVDLALYNSGVYTPGVYCTPFASGASIGLSGITLNGSGTYIFRIAGSLVTADHSVVTLSNGASACDVFWTTSPGVAVSILGAYSKFIGTLIEPERLTIKDHLSWTGRALVYNGSVSIDEKDNISVPTCISPPPTGILHVVKQVINNDGGVETSSSFTIHVKKSGSMGSSDVAGSPASGVGTPGKLYTLAPGTYTVSENAFPGYTTSFSGDCDANGNVILAFETSKICTITNDDVAQPPVPPATLHVIKKFYNDFGGTAIPSDAIVHVKNGAGDVAGSPTAGAATPGTSYTLNAGTYTVSENAFPGYTAIYGNDDCDYSGNVTLAPGDNKTCTISNDENPSTVFPATLHVIKHVINNDGGTATASSFSLHVKGTGAFGLTDVAGSPAAGSETPGKAYVLVPGNYVVSEDTHSGYTQSFSGDCDASGNITLAASSNKTCTITNDDSKLPPPPFAFLHVIKKVINNDGGTAIPSSFTINVKSGGSQMTGSPAPGAPAPGTLYTLAAGTYAVSENTFSGYTQSFSGDCTGGIVTLISGDDKTCIVTNDDSKLPPPPGITPATLHIIKVVINNDGGTKKVSSFKLYVKKTGSSGSGNVTGSPAAGTGAPGKTYTLKAGTYVVGENNNAKYTKKISGDCDAKGKVTLLSGDDKTCTITNDDIATYVPPYVPPVVTPPTATTEIPLDSIWKISPKLPDTGIMATKGLPMRIKIPTIGVNAPIQHVGIGKNGIMVAPTGPTNTAWFNLGPPPGAIGSSVIAGHFGHWLSGSGSVFDNLFKLQKGDKIFVTDDAGKTITFIVRENKIYDPETYTPDTNIFLSHDGKAHLNLITCDGAWNKITKSFPKRRVVFTDKKI